jgi:hypothetical protein
MSNQTFSQLLISGRTFREQAALYRAGRYQELTGGGDSAAWLSLLKTPSVPVWLLLLLLMDEIEADRTVAACELIDRSADEDKATIIGILRDSIVRNGKGRISDGPAAKPTPAAVRFAVFFVIEKLRAVGLNRGEAIDFVTRVYKPRDSITTLSAQTIRHWYDKKHGAGYTGLKQLAELLVGDAGPLVDPFLETYNRMIVRNTKLVRRLHAYGVISANERTAIKYIAKWLHTMVSAFHCLFFDDNGRPDARVRRRLRSIDRDKVIETAMPLLFGQTGSTMIASRHH